MERERKDLKSRGISLSVEETAYKKKESLSDLEYNVVGRKFWEE
jgi:hypothetical protein